MNGWANYETWNAALWIGNDEFLYNTAKACVTYREGLETPWDKFVRCMCEGQIGRMLCKTGDGVAWDDPAIDADEMNEMTITVQGAGWMSISAQLPELITSVTV